MGMSFQQSLCDRETQRVYLEGKPLSGGRIFASWWFQIFFIFPPTWEKIPILTHIFQVGWFNHQLVWDLGILNFQEVSQESSFCLAIR